MENNRAFIDAAHNYAVKHSTCAKVIVGSVIVPWMNIHIGAMYGCNHGALDCKKNGCRRIRLYGENSKQHRLPSDCDAIHSEIDAIARCAKYEVTTQDATIYVTRYPCEACARAIVAAGITEVVYGRSEDISEYTQQIFDAAGVKVIHDTEWIREDDNA